MSNCPTPSGYFHLPDGRKIPASCRSWTCPVCGQVKKNEIMDRVKMGCNNLLVKKGVVAYTPGGPDAPIWRFLTLTQSTRDDSDIMDDWNRLRSSLSGCGYKIEYFLTKEFTTKGKRHLHVLIDCWIPQKLLKRLWYKATGGKSYIVHITRWNAHHPAAYMTKYMTKSVGEFRFAKRERRYTSSRGFLPSMADIRKWNGLDEPPKGARYDYNPHLASVDIAFPRLRFLPYRIIRWLGRGLYKEDQYTGKPYYEPLPAWSRGCVTCYY